MLEARSALTTARPFAGEGLAISEAGDFSLTQLAWFGKSDEKTLKDLLGALPARVGQTAAAEAGTLLRIGPQQLWLLQEGRTAALPLLPSSTLVTPLSSSRSRIAVTGPKARDLLARCAAIDFHASALKPGSFVMTGIHHTPALIHCTGEDSFHVFAMRTFGLAVWEWLTDAATGL